MSMHLVGPYMTTTNYKKRRNVKFKSAEHKRKYEQQQAEWEALLKKYKIDPTARPAKAAKSTGSLKDSYKLTVPAERDSKQYPSLSSTGVTGGGCARVEPKVYTGDKLLGIATMHKSNMVPVFSTQDAEDISKMRRG